MVGVSNLLLDYKTVLMIYAVEIVTNPVVFLVCPLALLPLIQVGIPHSLHLSGKDTAEKRKKAILAFAFQNSEPQ